MDVDWAESQVPSAELRVGEREPRVPARLTLAQAARTELISDHRDPEETREGVLLDQAEGLCSDEACVRARNEAREQHALRVDLNVDALAVALASALASALDGRVLSNPASPPTVLPHTPVATPKRSFWAGAWHADVVLSSIAILVVVIVLLAWTV